MKSRLTTTNLNTTIGAIGCVHIFRLIATACSEDALEKQIAILKETQDVKMRSIDSREEITTQGMRLIYCWKKKNLGNV